MVRPIPEEIHNKLMSWKYVYPIAVTGEKTLGQTRDFYFKNMNPYWYISI